MFARITVDHNVVFFCSKQTDSKKIGESYGIPMVVDYGDSLLSNGECSDGIDGGIGGKIDGDDDDETKYSMICQQLVNTTVTVLSILRSIDG